MSRRDDPTPPLTVRAATPDDLETVLALRLDLLREAREHPVYGRLRPDAARRARRLFRLQLESASEVTLLAQRGGRVVGILRCVDAAGSALLEPDRFAYVSSVYVVPRARRSGVLHALLARAADWCAARGLGEMRLHSVAGAAANAAWDALGFQLVEHLRIRAIRR
jgi:GNAT superfamily N-acetyltransferase